MNNADAHIESLYKAHGTALHGYVMSMLGGDRPAAEDIVQETMLRAWQHADAVTAVASPRAWLFTVAHRLIIDRWRSRTARPREVADTPLLYLGVPDHAEDADTGMLVRAALTELTPKYRAALVEVYLHDRTTREAAAVLDIPIGTMKSRLHAALHTLRAILTASAHGDAQPGRASSPGFAATPPHIQDNNLSPTATHSRSGPLHEVTHECVMPRIPAKHKVTWS
jgi:RNA polymerase sigma-70 factor (ECF subfamily)